MIRGLRESVRLTSRETLRMFDLVDIWAARTDNEVTLVSANDHVHARGSAHYAGVALDLHSSDAAGLSAALRQAGFRVLWNVPGHWAHVHVELLQSGEIRSLPPVVGGGRASGAPAAGSR